VWLIACFSEPSRVGSKDGFVCGRDQAGPVNSGRLDSRLLQVRQRLRERHHLLLLGLKQWLDREACGATDHCWQIREAEGRRKERERVREVRRRIEGRYYPD
jgi:hypothetical protein